MTVTTVDGMLIGRQDDQPQGEWRELRGITWKELIGGLKSGKVYKGDVPPHLVVTLTSSDRKAWSWNEKHPVFKRSLKRLLAFDFAKGEFRPDTKGVST